VLTLWSYQVSDLDQVDGHKRTSKQDERTGLAMAPPSTSDLPGPPEAVLVSGLGGAREVAADLLADYGNGKARSMAPRTV
jgi:hypothetical protein